MLCDKYLMQGKDLSVLEEMPAVQTMYEKRGEVCEREDLCRRGDHQREKVMQEAVCLCGKYHH